MFVGTYSATEIEADDKYKLLGGNDGTVIANVSEAGTLKGTRCYFLFPSGSQPVNKCPRAPLHYHSEDSNDPEWD